ncbi:probable arabinosyltransferase ARAD1 [Magnolia sinica]|uniref:probable arabinosyltransferase ARAD1 n=1 Tax=Magnolia sinica TaxID=86752 RepID=UPI00265B2E28|nr:probable arabinosyltransferase ARAD1 [Magnolia sinica]
MTERNMQTSICDTRKFIFCLFSISIVILICSCFFLMRSSSNSLLPESVLMLMLANNTQVFKSSSNSSVGKLPYISSPVIIDAQRPVSRIQYNARQGSNSDGEVRVLGKETRKACDPNQALLKVFMYDLPPEFHFGLLGWKSKGGEIWPDVGSIDSIPEYPGGLNLQHSMEYWLTLDLLSSNVQGVVRPCIAVRVKDSSQADVVFVPFFSSVSYNRYSKLHGKEKVSKNKMLQDKLVEFLVNQEEWKRWRGNDHLIVAHHPNSMLGARSKFGSAMFVLADFGRYPVEIANIKKDIIAPYRHVVRTVGNDSAPFEGRPILVYFQGAIYRKDGGVIRQELYYLLKDEKDVHFVFGSAQGNGINRAGQGMRSSKFCLNIAGDTPSSNRLFDAIASHCIPVIISDEIELPFEDVLDYSKFCIFVRGSDAVKKGFLLNLLRGIKRDEWTMMWKRLQEVVHHFEYQYPSQHGDSVQMIWEAVARKIPSVRLKLHRENRFHQFHPKKKPN